MSKNRPDAHVPSTARRSGLPRLTAAFPSVLQSRFHASETSPSSESFLSHSSSPLSRFQPLALKRVFSGQAHKEKNQEQPRNIESAIINVGCTPRSSASSCSSWIPNFHSKQSSAPWDPSPTDEIEYRETYRDDSSTFSRQLAKITRGGSDEDIWGSCSPCLSGPRPIWPADGSHNSIERLRVTKEALGRRVVISGKEEGTLRYFGRTAFASGHWCGIELEKPLGKNDGSVNDVIYFSCAPGHGIFAPEHKVSILEYSETEFPMKRPKYGPTKTNESLYRLSTGSSSSSSSGLSGHSIDSKRSSGGSSATYTIVGRASDSFPTTPEEYRLSKISKRNSACIEEGEFGNEIMISPGDITYEDSSLGILSPDQMPDFTATGSTSMERSPSDEDVAALEDEVCDEVGAVGGDSSIKKWDSQGSISGIEEELLQRDISVIIRELKRKEVDSSSTSSSPSVHNTLAEEKSNYDPIEPSLVCEVSVRNKSKVLEPFNVAQNNLFLLEETSKESYATHEKRNEQKVAFDVKISDIVKESPSKVVKNENEQEVSDWNNERIANMTTSAASLDQGYQGDGEFDAPSEPGSVTASSPFEDPRLFERVIDIERIGIDQNSTSATDADISLADDDAELENAIIPRDRAARIIDGKLYHNHRELVAFRQIEGRHDAHTSEMDSSGFYSDLDPRDEDSTRFEVPPLQPLKESKLDSDLHDSVLDDTTHEDDDMMEYASVTKQSPSEADSNSLCIRDKQPTNEDASLIEDEERSSTSTIRSESKDLSSSEQHAPVPSDSSTATNLECNKDLPPIISSEETLDTPKQHEEDATKVEQERIEVTPLKKEDLNSPKSEADSLSPATARNYEKPWLSKPVTPRKVEKPKVLLPPPPPMPKKNVQSKLKALLEASNEPSSEERRVRQVRKGRWDEVMSRIEEGKKEEKVKPKEVKSRLMDALKTPQPISPQVERIRQERRERRERRERQAAATAVARRMSERKRSIASNRASRAPSLDSIGGALPATDSRASTPEISLHSTSIMSPIIKDSDSPHEPPHLEETSGETTSPAPVTPFPEDIVNPQKAPPSLSNCNGDTPKSTLSKSKSSQQLETVTLRDKRRSLGSFFGSRLSAHSIDLEKDKEKCDQKSFSKAKKEEKKEPKLKRSQSLRVKGKSSFPDDEDKKKSSVEKLNPILRKDKSMSSVSLKEDKPSKLKSFATKLTRLPKLTFADIPETNKEPFHTLRRTQSMKFTTKKSISSASNIAANPASPVSDTFHTLTPTRKSSYSKLPNHSSKSSRMNGDATSSNQKSKSMYDVRESLKLVPKKDDSNVKVIPPNALLNKKKNNLTERLNLNLTKDAAVQSKTFAHKTIDVIRKSVKNKLRNNLSKQNKMKTVLEDKSMPNIETDVEKTTATKDKKQGKLNSKRKKIENNESDNEGKPKKKALQRGKVQQTGKDSTLSPLLNNKTDKKKIANIKNNNNNTKTNLDINGNKGCANSDKIKTPNKIDNKKRNAKHHGLISDDYENFPLMSASVGGESNLVKTSQPFDSRHNAASDETNIHSLFLSQIDGTLNRNHDDIYSFPVIRKRTDLVDKNGNENEKMYPFPNSSFLESAFAKFSGSLPLIVAKIAFKDEDESLLQEPTLTKSYSEMCISESSVTPSLQESDMKSVSPMSMSHHEEERAKRDSNSPMSFTDHDAYIDDSMDELVIKGEGESYFGTLFTESRFLWDNFNESFTEMETDFTKDFFHITPTEVEMCCKNLNPSEDVFHSTPNEKSKFSPREKTLWEFEDRDKILISCDTCDNHDQSTRLTVDHSFCAPIPLESVHNNVPLDQLKRGVVQTQNDNVALDSVGTCYNANENSARSIAAQQMPIIDYHETDSITSGYVSIGERDVSDHLVPFSEAECLDISLKVEQQPKEDFLDAALQEESELESVKSLEPFKGKHENVITAIAVLKCDETILNGDVQGSLNEKWLPSKSLNDKEQIRDEVMTDEHDYIAVGNVSRSEDKILEYSNDRGSIEERKRLCDAIIDKDSNLISDIDANSNSPLGTNGVKTDCEKNVKNKLEPVKSKRTDDENYLYDKKDSKLKIRKSSTESDLVTRKNFIKSGSPPNTSFDVSGLNKSKRPKPEPSQRKITHSRLPGLKEATDFHNKEADMIEKKRKTSAKLSQKDERKEHSDKGIEKKKIVIRESHESISMRNKDVKVESQPDSLNEDVNGATNDDLNLNRAQSPCSVSDVSLDSYQSQSPNLSARQVVKKGSNLIPRGVSSIPAPRGSVSKFSSATSGGIGTPSSGRLSSARDHRLGSRVPPKTSRLAYSGNTHEETKGEAPTTPTPLPRRSKIDTLKGAQAKSQRTTKKLTDPVKVLRSTAPNVQLRTSIAPPSSDQLKKLEAELSDRSKELHSAEEEATRASRGVEALTVLVHHLVKEYEAFSTPRLKSEIDRLCCQLTDVQLCLDESCATARRLEDEAIERSKKHAEEIEKQEEKHCLEVTAITEEHQRRTQEILEKHQLELREAITKEESKHDELIQSHKCELERIENEWRVKLDQQHERHLQALQELNTSHTQQFKKAEAAWEAREKELQETNSKLLKEQCQLKQQAKKLEETLLSDKDHRLQAAKSVCTALQNEVDSLKTVVEMRNTEVHKLRDQVTDRERMTEDLEAARERVRALQAKTEDLLAQMEKKSKLERQLLADQHVLAESLQRESSANKLLSLENEELQWKLKQREQALAGTFPMATLEPTAEYVTKTKAYLVTRCSPNIPRQEDGCKSGGSSPLVTPRFQRNGSRSQSILKNEFEKRWSHSYHGTSEEMGKLFRKSELLHEDFAMESPPPSPRVKGVIEKSNSVSFILDLNDTFPEDPFLGLPSSPLLRKPRTPTLSRKPIQKSFSNAALEKSSSTSFILGRSCRDASFAKKEMCFYQNEGNYKIGRREENGRGRSAEDIPPQTPPLFPPKYNGRGHSTSDSSDGGDGERVSPTGLAWTVPVHSKPSPKRYPRSSKDIPHRFQLVPETPRLLQQPDEDEYEETENEFVEVLTLDGEDLSSAPLTTLFAQTSSTSVSLSDSDISQCGSRGDLSTEDDSTDDEDGTQRGSLSDGQGVKWRPQDGAGESMILPDVFGLAENQKENLKNSCTQISKSQISSAPSSDSEDPPQHLSLNGESGLNGSWSEDAECDLTSSSEMQEL